MNISNKPVFIALSGTLNAGKDILGEELAKNHGFLHASTSDMIRHLKKEAFGDTPEALLLRNDPFINELRQQDPGFLITQIYTQWKNAQDTYPGGFVASGVRAIGEVDAIKALGGIVIFVDAEPKVRYERSLLRARDAADTISFEAFLASEKREMSDDRQDKTVQNLSAMKDMADIVLDSSEQNIPEFCEHAIEELRRYFAR